MLAVSDNTIQRKKSSRHRSDPNTNTPLPAWMLSAEHKPSPLLFPFLAETVKSLKKDPSVQIELLHDASLCSRVVKSQGDKHSQIALIGALCLASNGDIVADVGAS